MRVISGYLGGRVFEDPRGHRTHPMSEKIRGAMFNMLGDVKGLTFLDAFSGTGALTIEAISRGAGFVVAVELDMEAYKTVLQNIKSFNLDDKVEMNRKDVKAWSRNHPGTQFDVILIDPPYDAVPYTLLHKLATHTKVGGLAVYSLPPDHDFKLEPKNFELIAEKQYGDATLAFYRRIL